MAPRERGPVASGRATGAEVHDAVVLHYDKDFDTIAAVTGQTARWIVERGTGG